MPRQARERSESGINDETHYMEKLTEKERPFLSSSSLSSSQNYCLEPYDMVLCSHSMKASSSFFDVDVK